MKKFMIIISLAFLGASSLANAQEVPSPIATGFGLIGMAIVISIAIFLIFRFVILWYWKINKIVSHLENLGKDTQQLIEGMNVIIEEIKASNRVKLDEIREV